MFQKGQLLRLQCKLMSLWFESYSLLSSQVLESHQAFLFSCLIWLALISCFCFHSTILPLKSKTQKVWNLKFGWNIFSELQWFWEAYGFLKLLLGVHCYMIPVPFCNDGSWKGQFVPNMILVNRFSELRQDFKTAEPWGTKCGHWTTRKLDNDEV